MILSFPLWKCQTIVFVKGWKDVIDIWDSDLKSKIESHMPTPCSEWDK